MPSVQDEHSSEHLQAFQGLLNSYSPDDSADEFPGERTDLMVRASDSGSGDPGSILGRVGVLFP